MNSPNFLTLINLFKLLCIITTCCMVGYWIHKYGKNEDVTTTEYISFEEKDEIILPELNICIINPFLSNKLENISNDLNTETYLKYLKGEISSNENLYQVDYDQVTLNLFEYLNRIVVTFRPGKNPPMYTCNNTQNCPYISFKANYSGFAGPIFYRCFGIETNRKYAKDVHTICMDFKSTLKPKLRRNSSIASSVRIVINYPHQQFRGMNSHHSLWTDRYDTKSISNINIHSIEILRHRNKPNHQCLEEWMYYDSFILREHMKKAGCRAPYQNSFEDLSVCDTKAKMKRSIFDIQTLPKLPVPCQEMSQLAFTFTNDFQIGGYEDYPILVVFPEKIRAITYSQAIDIHSLIGNIGGYIGLFLGYAIIQLPEMMKSFQQYTKAWFHRTCSRTLHSTNNVKRKLQSGKETEIRSIHCKEQSNANPRDSIIVLDELDLKEIRSQLQNLSQQLQQLFNKFDRIEANIQVIK